MAKAKQGKKRTPSPHHKENFSYIYSKSSNLPMSVFVTEIKVNNHALLTSTVHATDTKIYQVNSSIQYIH